MSQYPRNAVHQAEIDVLKLDLEADKSRVAVIKIRRKEDANQARADFEKNRLAVLARAIRLRSERLARKA
jgi:hypothetical protein